MLRNKLRKMTALLTATLLLLTAMQFTVFAAESTKLTILHVNDRHGRTEAEPYISQMAKDLKANGENVLILDAGDSIHGQTPTNLTKGETMVDIMNAVGYTAMAPGNHDFNFGVDRLLEMSKRMSFPVLAANVVTKESGERLFEACKIFDVDGLKVGVFGLATPETVTKSDPRIVAGLTFGDPAEAAEKEVAELKEAGCDVIIALVHLGDDLASDAVNRSDAVAGVEGVDIVIDGHSHTLLENGKKIGDTLVAQTGSFAENIGVVEITIDEEGNKAASAKLVAVPSGDDEEPSTLVADEAIVAKIEEEKAKIEPITGEVVGNTPVLLQGEREFVRVEETNLANLISDSMRFATEAEIAFLTGGNIRASIDEGDITMGEVLTTLPFSNLLMTVELSGEDMFQALELGVAKYPEPAGDHIQVSGIKFEYDPSAEPMSRVTSVSMADGSEFDKSKTYTVCVTEFIAAGGDGYEMMKNGTNTVYFGGDADAFADYLRTSPAISAEPEGRVKPVESVAAPELVPAPTPEPAPAPEPTPEPAPEPAPAVPSSPTAVAVSEAGEYTVQPGDNLTKIGNMYGLHWRDIFNANKAAISDANLIYPGQQLVIPPNAA